MLLSLIIYMDKQLFIYIYGFWESCKLILNIWTNLAQIFITNYILNKHILIIKSIF
jgi:hypothetical protein